MGDRPRLQAIPPSRCIGYHSYYHVLANSNITTQRKKGSYGGFPYNGITSSVRLAMYRDSQNTLLSIRWLAFLPPNY